MRKRPLYGRSVQESTRRLAISPARHLRESAEDTAYTMSETEDFIKTYTKDFTKDSGTIRTYYKEEKDDARKVLRDHYKNVEISDGRRSSDEEMCWVLAFSQPKALKEAVDWSHDMDWSGTQDPEKLSKEDKKIFKDAWSNLYDILTGARNKAGASADKSSRFTADDVVGSPYHDNALVIQASLPTVDMTPERDAFIDKLVQQFHAIRRNLKNGDVEIVLSESYRNPAHRRMIENAHRRYMKEALRRYHLNESRTVGLNPTRQKSYYGKANVIEDDNGRTYLQSYDTLVCYVDPNGKFVRLWDGESATTMKHINDFRRLCGLNPISVGEWRKLPVGRR